MAVSSTTQKVSVVSFHGGGALMGWIDPKAGMETNLGDIVRVSGDLVEYGVGDSQSKGYEYIHNLTVTTGEVYYNYSWPTGDGSIRAGTGLWPYGDVVTETKPGSGVFNQGSRLVYFTW